MGLKPETNDLIAFNEYLNTLTWVPNSKAFMIMENTKKGIEHFGEFEDEAFAIKRMAINFDNQINA